MKKRSVDGEWGCLERAYAVSEVARRVGVSQTTIRQWEREFPESIRVTRDEAGTRVFTEEALVRLEKVRALRDRGLSMHLVREVLRVFYADRDLAVEEREASRPSPALLLADFLQSRLEHVAQRQTEDLKQYVEERLGEVSEGQSTILSELVGIRESRRDRHRRKGVLERVFD